MTLEQKHRDKIIIYIIVAIIAIILIVAYVYVELATMPPEQLFTPAPVAQHVGTGPVSLSPAASAQKAATVVAFTSQKAKALSPAQAQAKAVALRKFLADNSGTPTVGTR